MLTIRGTPRLCQVVMYIDGTSPAQQCWDCCVGLRCNVKIMCSDLTMTEEESLHLEIFDLAWLYYYWSAAWFGEPHREQVAVLLYFTRIKLSPVPSGCFFLFFLVCFVSSQLAWERMWVINKRCRGFNLASPKILFSNGKTEAERELWAAGLKGEDFAQCCLAITSPSSDGWDSGPKLMNLLRATFWCSATVVPCLLACFLVSIICSGKPHIIHWPACSYTENRLKRKMEVFWNF